MTDDEMRIKIHEARGFTRKYKNLSRLYWMPPEGNQFYKMDFAPLDYLNDLNAMHEAEKVIEKLCHERGDDYLYFDNLVTIVGDPVPICATARQRAGAFLKTIEE